MTGTPVFDDASGVDSAVPWHFGDPHGEQRLLVGSGAVVDTSNRGVLQVRGADRLAWLNDLVTQQVNGLTPGDCALALILDPKGHVEFELHLIAAPEVVWITTEPGAAPGLATYLNSMRFLLDVAVRDVSDDYATLWQTGDCSLPAVAVWTPPGDFAGGAVTDAGTDAGGGAGKYVPNRPGVLPGAELIVARNDVVSLVQSCPRAGTWALEAVRVAAGVPRIGFETDHRTLPHEVGYIGPAVHLAKGCYRGQEAVARVHNLGRPPRRLVLLHLDGSSNELPAHSDAVLVGDRQVGAVGSVARHYELGPIATALIKSNVPSDTQVVVRTPRNEEVAATIEDVVVAVRRSR